MMLIINTNLLILVWVVLVTTLGAIGSINGDDLSLLRDACDKKVSIKSIGEFSSFMQLLRRVDPGKVALGQKDESLKKCLDDRASFFALEELVLNYDKTRPCKMSQIAKLEDFARKFLMTSYRPISVKFFTLFGVNIGFFCKLNLLAHVKQADAEADPLDFIYSMASPTGWNILINEHTKKSMKFGGSAHSANSVVNRIAKLVPGLDQIEQLEYLDFDQSRGLEQSIFSTKDRRIAEKLDENLSKIIQSCKNLDSFYVNSILSLARLSYLGLVVDFKHLNRLHGSSLMLHRWLAATSFCQLMSRVKSERPDDKSSELKLTVVHDDRLLDHRRKLYSYVAEFEDISSYAVDNVWLASVSDGRWRQRRVATLKTAGDSESDHDSSAMNRLRQFIRGLERDCDTAPVASD